MRRLRALVLHPAVLVVLAILSGWAIHQATSPGPDPISGAGVRVSRSLDAPRGAAAAQPAAPVETPSAAADAGVGLDASPPPPPPASQQAAPPSIENLEPVGFREVWAYLMAGEDARWLPQAGVTDVGLFNFRIDDGGHIAGAIDPATLDLARQRGARTHIVIPSANQKSLLHFLMNPNFRAQGPFLQEILRLSRRYKVDGLQLDFESLLPEDRLHFIAFLKELRSHLAPGLVFSLALPAREEVRADDPLRYRGLAELADRFIIMVYDEHWQGGEPGSVSSRDWHDRVVRHALKELPPEKVVVALPFYGRIWQLDAVARATRYQELEEFLRSGSVAVEYDLDKGHRFAFQKTVNAVGWFDDAATLHRKFAAASAAGAAAIGFWRLGQEDARVWSLIKASK
jgi:spore germination protein YaaH